VSSALEESSGKPLKVNTKDDDKMGSLDDKDRLLMKARPLLVLLRLVDAVKKVWDEERLKISSELAANKYLEKLVFEYIGKAALEMPVNDCEKLNKEYKEEILKAESFEELVGESVKGALV